MFENVKYLLLQVRNADDPMRQHEVASLSRALQTTSAQIEVFDLLQGGPSKQLLARNDVILFGGSGDYSTVDDTPWLLSTLEHIRNIYELKKPVFASCWGFQAIAKALGGKVIHDANRAEVGSLLLSLTEAGKQDPIFGSLSANFYAQLGHEDSVVELPSSAICLAHSELVENQAFCFPDRPIYATQFHPELNKDDLHQRVLAYPRYVEQIAGISAVELLESLQDTSSTETLLLRFVSWVLEGNI